MDAENLLPVEFLLDQRRIEVLQYTKELLDVLARHLPDVIIRALHNLSTQAIEAIEINRFAQLEVEMLVLRLREVDFWLAKEVPPPDRSEWEAVQTVLAADMLAFLRFFRVPQPFDAVFNQFTQEFPPHILEPIQRYFHLRAESGRAHQALQHQAS